MINDKLKEFCQKHEGITFFDATPIFSRGVGQGKHRLQNDLISPRGHPSELGFAVWEVSQTLEPSPTNFAQFASGVLPSS